MPTSNICCMNAYSNHLHSQLHPPHTLCVFVMPPLKLTTSPTAPTFTAQFLFNTPIIMMLSNLVHRTCPLFSFVASIPISTCSPMICDMRLWKYHPFHWNMGVRHILWDMV